MGSIRNLFKSRLFIFLFSFVLNLALLSPYTLFAFSDIQTLGSCLILSLLFGPFATLGCVISYVVYTFFNTGIFDYELLLIIIMFVAGVISWKLWYGFYNMGTFEIPNMGSFHAVLKLFITYTPFLFSGLVILKYSLLDYNPSDIFSFMGLFIGLISILFFVNYFKIPLYSPKVQIKQIFPFKLYDIFFIISVIISILIVVNMLPNELILLAVLFQILFLLKPFDERVFNLENTIEFNLIQKIIFSVFLIFLLLESIFLFKVFLEVESGSNFLNLLYIVMLFDDNFVVFIFSFFIPVFIYVYLIEKNVTKPINKISSALNEDLRKNINLNNHLKNVLNSIPRNNEVKRLANSLIQMESDVVNYRDELVEITSQKEKYETELKLADTIQSSMISTDFDRFSNGKNFEIWGVMNAAKEVGGDFYDYFEIDDDNIGFVIGDVSGKGITAALIMVKAMTLIKDYLKETKDVSKAFVEVNNLLCEGNVENLFVTCWLAKLNIKTGELTFVNAGHNSPLIKKNNNPFDYYESDHDLVLACMENMDYKAHKIQLNHGDAVFLYTDGVTEANDNYHGFYGEDRLKDIVNKYSNDELRVMISSIEKDTGEFCNYQEQFDDTTMFVIRYY